SRAPPACASSRLRHDRVEREPDELLQLRPSRVRLVHRARERSALAREERARVEDIVARGPAGAELVAADAEVLLRLHDPGACRLRRRETLLGAPLRRPDRGLELAQLALERDPG